MKQDALERVRRICLALPEGVQQKSKSSKFE